MLSDEELLAEYGPLVWTWLACLTEDPAMFADFAEQMAEAEYHRKVKSISGRRSVEDPPVRPLHMKPLRPKKKKVSQTT